MTDEKPAKRPKGAVIRARFNARVKLGGNELEFWDGIRHTFATCTASPAGLVFTCGAEADSETVVPWPNVASYDRSL